MSVKLASSFRLTVGAGKASPQPPVGSALGQRGLNLMNFCKAFNDQTAQFIVGTPMQAPPACPHSPRCAMHAERTQQPYPAATVTAHLPYGLSRCKCARFPTGPLSLT